MLNLNSIDDLDEETVKGLVNDNPKDATKILSGYNFLKGDLVFNNKPHLNETAADYFVRLVKATKDAHTALLQKDITEINNYIDDKEVLCAGLVECFSASEIDKEKSHNMILGILALSRHVGEEISMNNSSIEINPVKGRK